MTHLNTIPSSSPSSSSTKTDTKTPNPSTPTTSDALPTIPTVKELLDRYVYRRSAIESGNAVGVDPNALDVATHERQRFWEWIDKARRTTGFALPNNPFTTVTAF